MIIHTHENPYIYHRFACTDEFGYNENAFDRYNIVISISKFKVPYDNI